MRGKNGGPISKKKLPTSEILDVNCGHESIVLSTTDIKAAQKAYHRAYNYRLRIDGKLLKIHEADKAMSTGKGGMAWGLGFQNIEGKSEYV